MVSLFHLGIGLLHDMGCMTLRRACQHIFQKGNCWATFSAKNRLLAALLSRAGRSWTDLGAIHDPNGLRTLRDQIFINFGSILAPLLIILAPFYLTSSSIHFALIFDEFVVPCCFRFVVFHCPQTHKPLPPTLAWRNARKRLNKNGSNNGLHP